MRSSWNKSTSRLDPAALEVGDGLCYGLAREVLADLYDPGERTHREIGASRVILLAADHE